MGHSRYSLKSGIGAMTQKGSSIECSVCTVAIDEIMSVKESLSCNVATHPIKGSEDFGSRGITQYVPNHLIAFTVTGGCCPKGKSLWGIFSPVDPCTPFSAENGRQVFNTALFEPICQ